MKRDMDLVRCILLAAEASNESLLAAEKIADERWSKEIVARHIHLLDDAGLIEGKVSEYMGGGIDAFVSRLTWEGYDFLDSVRDENVWTQTMASIKEKIGTASFDVIKTVAAGIALRLIGT